ncbi:DUF6250 domain-containing protein [Granulicella sp. dw_53]|uniref:DUF6250 domain-containing protein n=1 Tax=Granulicella sp. dw_53 TaxID=2719792 RepID=UPI001BD6D4BF|nr:DUF6250 domain-containing protein [Granulicella sp. dw_53]
MKRTLLLQRIRSVAVCAIILVMAAVTVWCQATPPDKRLHAGKVLYADDFTHGLGSWRVEMEKPGAVTGKDGVLDIDVPAGVTVWFRQELDGPVMIQYEATVVSASGPNDRVSDLNSFWMATDPRAPDDLFAHERSGKFAEYNLLSMYYVGLGGNGNTTTRFRRYIGDETERPLLPQNDLSVSQQPSKGIVPNKVQTITLIADEHIIQYWRDTERIFEMIDQQPYTKGWFGIRTTKNHMQIRNLRIVRLVSSEDASLTKSRK